MKKEEKIQFNILLSSPNNKVILVDGDYDYEIKPISFEPCNEKYNGDEVYLFSYKDKIIHSLDKHDKINGEFTEKVVFNKGSYSGSTYLNVIGKNEIIYYYFNFYRYEQVGIEIEKIMDLFENKNIYFTLNTNNGVQHYIRKEPNIEPGPYRGTFSIYIKRMFTGPCGGGYDMTVPDPSLVCKYSDGGVYDGINNTGKVFVNEELFKKYKL